MKKAYAVDILGEKGERNTGCLNHVQCERPECNKWRILPWFAEPCKTFFCILDKWDPDKASCNSTEAPYDERAEGGGLRVTFEAVRALCLRTNTFALHKSYINAERETGVDADHISAMVKAGGMSNDANTHYFCREHLEQNQYRKISLNLAGNYQPGKIGLDCKIHDGKATTVQIKYLKLEGQPVRRYWSLVAAEEATRQFGLQYTTVKKQHKVTPGMSRSGIARILKLGLGSTGVGTNGGNGGSTGGKCKEQANEFEVSHCLYVSKSEASVS